MSTDLFKKIAKLNLPWTRLTKNQAHVLDFMFDNPNPIDLVVFANWISTHSIDWVGLNQSHWFLDKVIKKLYNVSEQDQLAWYDWFFSTNKEFLDKSIGSIVCYAHSSLVDRAIEDGANLTQTYGVLKNSLLHLVFYKLEEITEQDVKIADMLIDSGLDLNKFNLNKYTPFEYLVANTSKWILHFLKKGGVPNVQYESNDNILFAFAFIKKKCSIEIFKELVELGVDYKYMDQHNFTLLHWATWLDLDEHIKYLYSLGLTDFCAIPKGKHDYYPKGLTPLHHVFMYCSEETCSWVITHAPQLVTPEYKNSHGFLIKSAYSYLLENNKLTKQQKITLYEQLRETVKQKHYTDSPVAWFFHSKELAIPTDRDLSRPFELRYKMTPHMEFK